MNRSFKYKGDDTAVTAALTDIAVLGGLVGAVLGDMVGGQIINMEVQNNGANAFTDFRIRLKDHPDGEWYDYLLAADFASPNNSNMIFASVDPSTLAGGAKSHIIFRCNAAWAVNVQAKRTLAASGRVLLNCRAS